MQRKEWAIKAENELRCEVGETEPLYIKLLSGNAEIFGVEMALNKEYTFLDENFAIFSWYGCMIETVGNNEIAMYISDSTPMVSYVNTHIQLEARRDVALANGSDGPRVLIVGPSDHGIDNESYNVVILVLIYNITLYRQIEYSSYTRSICRSPRSYAYICRFRCRSECYIYLWLCRRRAS